MTRKEELNKYPLGFRVILQMYPHLVEQYRRETVSHSHTDRRWRVNWNKVEGMLDGEYRRLLDEVKSSDRIQNKYSSYESFVGLMDKLSPQPINKNTKT